jgi:hypothetical protein
MNDFGQFERLALVAPWCANRCHTRLSGWRPLTPADLKTLALALASTLALALAISIALAVALATLLPALLTRVLTFIRLELVLVAYPQLLLLLRRAEIRLVAQLLPVLQLGALLLLRVGGAY